MARKSNGSQGGGKRSINGQASNLEQINKLLQENVKLSEERLKQQEKINKSMEKEQILHKQIAQLSDNIEKSKDQYLRMSAEEQKKLISNADKQGNLIARATADAKVPRNISGWFNQSINNKMKSEYSKIAEKVYNEKSNNGTKTLNAKDWEEMENTITKEFSSATKKYTFATDVFSNAAKVFNSAISTWIGVAKKGISNQTNTYESTFTDFSVRTGVSKERYRNGQLSLNNELGSLGLRDNIASSEVMQMWDKLSQTGMSSENAFAKSIDTVLTNTIVPYLDMSSTNMQILADQQPGLMKQVRGIGSAVMEVEGSNYSSTKYLQDMLESLSPVSRWATNSLGKQYAKSLGIYEDLINKGYDDNAIGDIYRLSESISSNPYEAVTSNDSVKRLAATTALQEGGDLSDAGYITEHVLKSADFWANQMPEGNQSMLYAGLVKHYTGSSLSASTFNTINNANADIEEAIAKGNQAASEVDKNAQDKTDEFKRGKNQTNKTLQDITVENFMNELSVVNEWMGNWSKVIVDAIQGIGAIIMTHVVGGVIGKTLGVLGGAAAGGTGEGLLAAGGGVALGTIAGVAAVGAIATAIDKGISQHEAQTANNNAASYAKNYTTNQGDANSAGALSSYAQQLGRDTNTSKWKAGLWDNLGKNLAGSISNAFNFNGYDKNDPVSYNSEKWRRSFNEIHGKYDKPTVEWIMAAYAMAMMDAGNDSSIISKVFGGANITADGIKAFLHEKYKDEESAQDSNQRLQNAVESLKAMHLIPIGPNKQYSDLSWTDKDLQSWGMYRQGLDEVPYDDYPALLHEGEAVLTASTANELRNLVDEYRSTSEQSANFDAIINNQTSALVNKLDEVINVIKNPTSALFSNSNNDPYASVTSSMIRLSSTKSIFN